MTVIIPPFPVVDDVCTTSVVIGFVAFPLIKQQMVLVVRHWRAVEPRPPRATRVTAPRRAAQITRSRRTRQPNPVITAHTAFCAQQKSHGSYRQ